MVVRKLAGISLNDEEKKRYSNIPAIRQPQYTALDWKIHLEKIPTEPQHPP
jgi:hypothetical protein